MTDHEVLGSGYEPGDAVVVSDVGQHQMFIALHYAFKHPLTQEVVYASQLGERRARAAYDYLVSLGVPAERLRTVSYGKEIPVEVKADDSPLTLADATGRPFATPLKWGGVTIPTTPGSFEPINDLRRGGWMLAVQSPPFENTLDRFGHIQPRATQRGV